MAENAIKPATISNNANETDINKLAEMVNHWLEEERMPLDSWDEIETDDRYKAEILRVASIKWEVLSANL